MAASALLRFRQAREDGAALAADPAGNKRPANMTRAEWKEVLRDRRDAWRTPAIDTLQRPVLSMSRRIGLLALRGYILFAIVIMVIKLIQVTTAH